jgi:hypothetical protein
VQMEREEGGSHGGVFKEFGQVLKVDFTTLGGLRYKKRGVIGGSKNSFVGLTLYIYPLLPLLSTYTLLHPQTPPPSRPFHLKPKSSTSVSLNNSY